MIHRMPYPAVAATDLGPHGLSRMSRSGFESRAAFFNVSLCFPVSLC